MESIAQKKEGNKVENQAEIKRGRPRKDKSAALFLDDNSVNPLISDTCDIDQFTDNLESETVSGTVGEGGGEDLDFDLGFSLEDRMRACATLARRGRTDAVRLQAIIKYSELERQQRAELGEADLGEECLAFIRMVKASTPAELVEEL